MPTCPLMDEVNVIKDLQSQLLLDDKQWSLTNSNSICMLWCGMRKRALQKNSVEKWEAKGNV